jgi:acetyl/propionyl-CoA carboxylase alpha subunit
VYYDPMIAKLIVHAADRQQGLDRMDRALREFLILGVNTSIPLHRWLMAHPAVRSGEVDTSWLEREWSVPEPDERDLERAAVAAALVAHTQRSTSVAPADNHAPTSAWRLAARRSSLQ